MSFSLIFLRGLFYWLTLFCEFLTILVYALIAVSLLLLLEVKTNQRRKLISFIYTFQSWIEAGFWSFYWWEWVCKNNLKLISAVVGEGVAISLREENVNTYFFYKKAHIRNIFFYLVVNKMKVEEGCKTTKLMQYFNSSDKVQ